MHGETMKRVFGALVRAFVICGLGLLWLVTAPLGLLLAWAAQPPLIVAEWASEKIAENARAIRETL